MSSDRPPFHNPFGALGGLRDKLPAASEKTEAPAAPPTPPKAAIRGRTYARAVVRMERAGRSGKEATVIEQLELTSTEREGWLKALKAALGCGGSVEGGRIMLQGDHRDRLKRLLADRGVRKVIVS